jgi:tetratricopeptide (TPR) repeat protein
MMIRSRRLKIAFVLVLVLAGVAAAGWKWGYPYYQARRDLAAADESEAHFKYAAAREHIIRAAKFWPEDGEVQLKAARMCRRAGYPDEAKDYLDAARKYLGQSAVSLEQQLLTVQNGEASAFASKTLYVRVEKEHDIRALVYEAFVVDSLNNARIVMVKELADSWLAEPTNDPRPWYWRGLAEMLMGATSMDDLAIKDFTRALELDPDLDDARSRLCTVLLLSKRDIPEARAQYEIFLKRRPESIEAKIGLGRCLVDSGEADAARVLFDEALEKAPKNVDALRERGVLALTEGHADQAEPYLRKAYELDPRDLGVSQNFVLCLRALGRDDEAKKQQVLHDAMASRKARMDQRKRDYGNNPSDPNIMLEIGKLYLELGGKENETIGLSWIIDRALKTDPRHVPSLKTLVDYLEKRGRSDQADYFRRMIPADQGR